MKQIDKDIKEQNFKSAYLLFGEESYLVKEYCEKLKKAIIDDTNSMMNIDVFEGKEYSVAKIADACDTAPFFSPYRLVMVSESGLFKDGRKDDTQFMANLVKNMPEDCVLVFYDENVDKRNSLYKAVKKVGYCCEFNTKKVDELSDWILKKSDGRLNMSTASYFVNYVGTSMTKLSVELDKLFDYTGDRKVTQNDINTACSKSLETYIFDMVDAMANKRPSKALDIYNNMIFDGEEPIKILVMIARQFRLMLQCKYLQSKNNYNALQISAELKQNKFVVTNCLKQSVNFKISTLMKAIDDCTKCDTDIKSGIINPRLGVELILLKYCK